MSINCNSQKKLCAVVLAAVTLAGSSIPAPAQAQSGTELQQDAMTVLNEMSQEATECAVYYEIASVGMKNAGDVVGSGKTLGIAERLIAFAQQVNGDETTEARMHLVLEEQMKAMDSDFGNFSRLMLRYNDLCAEVLHNPGKRAAYWASKIAR